MKEVVIIHVCLYIKQVSLCLADMIDLLSNHRLNRIQRGGMHSQISD
jgi:hypothetical protein